MRKAKITEIKRLGKTVWQLDGLHPTKKDVAGKPLRFKRIYSTELEAQQADAKFILMEREGPQSSNYDPFITVEEYAKTFLKLYSSKGSDRSAGTIRNVESNIRLHILPMLGKKKMVDINLGILRELLYSRDTLSKASKKVLVQKLSLFFGWAVDSGIIVKSPTAKLGKTLWGGKSEIQVVKAMDEPQMTLFFETSLEHHPSLFPIYATLGWAGLRIGELLHLKVKDVTESHLIIHNHEGQTRHLKTASSTRKVEVSPLLWEALEGYRERSSDLSPNAWFFFPELPSTMEEADEEQVRKHLLFKLHWLLKKAGLPDHFNLHSLRHSFGSQHIARGTPPKWVQQQLGHATLAMTTETYGGWLPAEAPGATNTHSQRTRPKALLNGKKTGNSEGPNFPNIPALMGLPN